MVLIQDIRYGVRVLLKSPGFLIAAVLSLALGIGANTTIFTMVNALFLQPLPVEKPSELMYVYGTDTNNSQSVFGSFLPVSYPNYVDYRAQNNVFTDTGMYTFPLPVSLGSAEKPIPLNVQIVSGNYFNVLGVHAALGRTFLPEEDQTLATHAVAVLNYKFWQKRFGGNPATIGSTIRLNGHPFTVIGVAPSGFDGTFGIFTPDLWAPAMTNTLLIGSSFPGGPMHQNRRLLFTFIFGRLKPSVTMAQAQAALQTIGKRLAQEYPNDNADRNVGVLPLMQATIPPPFRGIILQASALLMAIVGMVLLIACANIANLMMARATARRREFTVRLALGSARSRLISQLLTESVLVALPGGLLALAVAVAGRNMILSFMPPFANAGSLNMPLDPTVLGFTFALSIVSGLLFGIAPSLRASKADLAADLKERAGTGSTPGRLSVRNILILCQVALSVIALASAGFFIRSLGNAQKIDLGLEHEKLVIALYDVSSNGYDQPRGREFHRQLLERMRALPGVASATLASAPPLFPPFQRSVFPEGRENAADKKGVLVFSNVVATGYFDAVRLPLVRGRLFTDADREGQPLVAVINEAMVKRFWPNEDPLGKRFRFYGDVEPRTIVGIARTAKVVFAGEDPQPVAYSPLEQNYGPALALHVRTSGNPDVLKPTVERELRSMDRDVAVANVWTGPELLNISLWAPRMAAALLGIFGTIALVLAAVGIYGVMSYSVSQRASEIGIRIALGAERRDVIFMVLRQGMLIAAIGLAVGLVTASAIGRLLSRLLYGVSATDIPTFGGVAAALLLVALFANYIPARRATVVDPVTVMRYE